MTTGVVETFAIYRLYHIDYFLKNMNTMTSKSTAQKGPVPKSCIGSRTC